MSVSVPSKRGGNATFPVGKITSSMLAGIFLLLQSIYMRPCNSCLPDTKPFHRQSAELRPSVHICICVSMHGSFDGACDNLLLSVKLRCVVENAVHNERPILHEALHIDCRFGSDSPNGPKWLAITLDLPATFCALAVADGELISFMTGWTTFSQQLSQHGSL